MIYLFRVRGESMKPLFQDGDFVVAERMSYLFSKPRVGHIVLVKHPKEPNILLVKRLVQERKGEYWVEGNNRLASTDSRVFGWVGKSNIVGRAYAVGKPRTTRHNFTDVGGGTGLRFA